MLTSTERIESFHRVARLRSLGLLMAAIALATACGGDDAPAPPPPGPAPAPGPAPGPGPGPAPAPPGNAGQCFDLALLETNGTTTNVAYEHTGRIIGNTTVASVVNAPATFEGQASVEHVHHTTGTNTRVSTGEVTNIDMTVKGYGLKTGTAEVTQYGTVTTSIIEQPPPLGPVSMEVKVVWSPAWVDTQYGLNAGDTVVRTLQANTTITIGSNPPGGPISTTVMPNIKFHGVESVTVPAGTYSTCKFEQFDTVSPATNTFTWLIVGKGILVKSMDNTSEGVQTISATAVTLNGQAL